MPTPEPTDPQPLPAYTSVEQLAEILGSGMHGDRAMTAVEAANRLVAMWTPRPDPDVPGAVLPGPITGITVQAALELAQTLYRRQAATGGFTDFDDLVARLPADLVRGIRDLLDTETELWGLA